jgi:hypothetical protein
MDAYSSISPVTRLGAVERAAAHVGGAAGLDAVRAGVDAVPHESAPLAAVVALLHEQRADVDPALPLDELAVRVAPLGESRAADLGQ